ncbi:MAG: alpha/beta hydrolase [Nocardioides sp.]|jgi:pimeloyl-ACP methyl ester carboxylesterase|uniref:alpha/beta hydrolase n=1 Tax=Nocardioides sp. TaxID=35761 RepID=UPI00260A8C56|nr:alpha/beta hydrolase [Nocardioides sp.]MCW2832945.1 alpha/beta hydrolase [Nocardioides sp.]
MKKLLALVVVIALVASTFWAVAVAFDRSEDEPAPSPGDTSSSSSPTEPDGSSAPSPDLESFYSQKLDWQDCEGDFECAELTVPLDYADAEGETIEVALLKVPGRGDRQGSLVVNPGGPGAPGTDYAAAASRVFREPLLRAFDIVGFDPRGTGASAPVDCLTDDELDEYLASDPNPDTAAEEEEFAELVEEFGRGCAERSGDAVNHVSTIEAARDMDVLRSALGETTLTYLGASYGTKLGATYAELFPDKVGRLVLDGAVDVSLDNRQLGIEQAAGFETALRSYIQNCIDTAETCFLGDSVDEGLATIEELLAGIESDPLPADDDRELKIGNAFYGIVTPLYNRDYWFLLSAALRSALDGSGTALMELADIYASRGPEGYTDNSSEAIFAINCLDDPSSVGFDEVDDQLIAQFEAASPTFGSIFAWSLTGCSGSRGETTEEPIEIRAEGAAPILVVGTTRDPATPLKWAEALAEQLESGVLLRRDGDGHTAYNSGNECIDTAIESYLLEGDVPADPTDC